MTQAEQINNAKDFAEFWADKGDEKQHTHQFWTDLLQNVLGTVSPSRVIDFEKRVKIGATKFIDGYIEETRTIIEQKGAKIDLARTEKQSDGAELTPFEQAKRYNDNLPLSQKARWIVVSNFTEFHIHDMEKAEPEKNFETVRLANLPREYYRLQFLVDQKNENIRREEEISLKAGILVGKLYDAIFPQYIPQPASHSEGQAGVAHPEKSQYASHSEPLGEESLPVILNEREESTDVSTGQRPTAQHDVKLSESQLRSLNILCVRIVFCLYAEDAGLFATRTAFEDYIKGFNLPNVRKSLIELFRALDTPLSDRNEYDEMLKPFPYVNGGLFRDESIEIPNFTQEIVDVIVNECAVFNWSEISPTIFGAVFESTLNPETRRKGGMHYTSIQNIHKVIDPLFIDDLNAEFEEICGVRQRDVSGIRPQHDGGGAAQPDSHSERREESIDVSLGNARRLNMTVTKKQREALHAFQEKLGSLTFLDPACGSGNFLTETYLSLRRLENKVISLLNKGEKILGFDEFIKVHINQFYGIEINDFAVTVAKTALWIAESQMVAETEAILSQTIDFLPLTNHANIIEGNSLRMDWGTLSDEGQVGYLFAEKLNIYDEADFEKEGLEIRAPEADATSLYGKRFKELNVIQRTSEHKKPASPKRKPVVYDYIMGNPPFSGARIMRKESEQKKDIADTFADVKGAGNLDYVCCWYKKAAEYMRGKPTKTALVSTNSIIQGEHVAILWKLIFGMGIQTICCVYSLQKTWI